MTGFCTLFFQKTDLSHIQICLDLRVPSLHNYFLQLIEALLKETMKLLYHLVA